jgi:hypothetical protein
MSIANAWILNLDGAVRAAIGMRELVQIIEAPNTFSVPHTPAYSRNVMFWQNRMVPVLDLSIRLGRLSSDGKLVAIVGYQDDVYKTVGLGAIILNGPPVRVAVDDSSACALDEKMGHWRELSNACFSMEDVAIPVLHLSRLFAAVV